MPVWNRSIVDLAGNVVPFASVAVRDSVTSNLVQLYSNYALSATVGNPITADASGFVRFYVADGRYQITATSGAFSKVWEDELLGQNSLTLRYDRTPAETTASVTPTDYHYLPGDIRRYGALPDGSTDCSAALSAAIAQAQTVSVAGAAPVRVPGASQGWKLVTGVTAVGSPFAIYGDTGYYSYFHTPNDIAMLTIQDVQQHQGVILEAVGFIRSTPTGSTKAAIHVKNSSYCRFTGILVQKFNKGVLYEDTATLPQSCYLCSIEDSTIIESGAINIDCEKNTNNLTLRNVTFGAAPIGLRFVDSTGLSVYGGDAEGCSTCKVDLDSVTLGTLQMGALISGCDFEASGCTAGDIRIGNTDTVAGVTLIGNYHSFIVDAPYPINPVRCSGLVVIDHAQSGGYATSPLIRQDGNLTNSVFLAPFGGIAEAMRLVGTLALAGSNVAEPGRIQFSRKLLTYGTSIAVNSAQGNLFIITASDGVGFTIGAPSNPLDGQVITIMVRNLSGGALGTATWNAVYKMSAWTNPANGFSRSVSFVYDSVNWVQCSPAAVDVPN